MTHDRDPSVPNMDQTSRLDLIVFQAQVEGTEVDSVSAQI